MQQTRRSTFAKVAAAALVISAAAIGVAQQELVDRFTSLTKGSNWELVSSEQLDFTTFHTQGMTRVGDSFFLSSVEIIERTERFDSPQDGYDRSPGIGRGLVFRMNLDGELQETIELGEGDMYHPGGIDFDGEYVWVPVAEYRPDSESVVYRIHAETLEVTEVFRFPDHLGGIELVDLTIDTAVFQLPVLLATEAGRPMTQNPFYVETTAEVLRAYFVPEDDTSHLFVYDIAVR